MFGLFKRRKEDPNRRFVLIFSELDLERQLMCSAADSLGRPWLAFTDWVEFSERMDWDDVSEVWFMEEQLERLDDGFKMRFRMLRDRYGIVLETWTLRKLKEHFVLFGVDDGLPPDDPGTPTAYANALNMPQNAWHEHEHKDQAL